MNVEPIFSLQIPNSGCKQDNQKQDESILST